MADRALTDLELERWLAGDLPGVRQGAATPADHARLEALRAEHAALLGAVDVDAEVRAIRARATQAAPVPGRRPGWIWTLSGGGALAAAAVIALVVVRDLRPSVTTAGPTSSGDDLQVKGDEISLIVHAAAETGSRRLATGDTVQAGDRLRFEVVVPTRGYLAIVGIDGTGASTVYYPPGGREPAAIDPGGAGGATGVLPGAIALDATPGDERFHAVFAARPFALDAALIAALGAGSAGAARGGVATATVILHKKLAPF